MNNTEITITIAEFLGWKSLFTFDSGKMIGTSPDGCFQQSVPQWTIDLNAARELIEHAEEKNVGFSLYNTRLDSHSAGQGSRIDYEATFFDPWGGPRSKEYRYTSDCAARAICLAWLEWIGKQS